MRTIRLLSLGVLIGLFGCSNPKAEKVAQLKNECIEIHDEVMPRWQEIAEMSGAIKKKSISLNQDTTDSAQLRKLELMASAQLLDSAYDAMGDWMEAYNPMMDAEQSVDSALIYYEKEKIRISEVNELMRNSIRNGEEVLAN